MAAITDADIAHIQSTYPLLNIKPLNGQQERFILMILRGLNPPAAEKAVGYKRGSGTALLAKPEVKAILEYYRQYALKDIKVTRDTLTEMLFEAHAKAGSATEEIMAIRELGKMHDTYESDKRKGVNIKQTIVKGGITNIKQIERLGDADLAELAGLPSLDPEPSNRNPVVIDAETGDIEDLDDDGAQ